MTIITRYGYLGYRYVTPGWVPLVLSIVLALGTSQVLPTQVKSASDFVLWVLFLVLIVPIDQVSVYSGLLDPGQAITTMCVVTAAFLLCRAAVIRPRDVPAWRFSIRSRWFWSGVLGLSVVLGGIMFIALGASLDWRRIVDVYALRAEYTTRIGGTGAVLSYLVGIETVVINPLLIAKGLISRRWVILAVGVILQLLFYAETGFKTVIFTAPAVLVVVLLFALPRRRSGRWMSLSAIPGRDILAGAALLILVCLSFDAVTGGSTLSSLFVRRFIATPGLATDAYVAFFSDHAQLHLSGSVLRGHIAYPYGLPPGQLIAQFVTGSSNSSMNVNLLGDGFANFGWAGVLAAGLALGMILRITDRVAAQLPPVVVASVLILPAITLSNSALLTTLFTHAVGVAVIALALIPRTGWAPQPGGRGWWRVRDPAGYSALGTAEDKPIAR